MVAQVYQETQLAHLPDPRKAVLDMLSGYIKPQLIYVAVKLGIPDLLQNNPLTCNQLCARISAQPAALNRLIAGLLHIGILEKDYSGTYSLTALGKCLTANTPGSLREIAILQGEEIFQAWSQLLYSVQTGNSAFERVFGAEFFQYLSQAPQSEKRFHKFMAATANRAAREFVASYDFSRSGRVIDVGGGNGVLMANLLKANPELEGLIFDIAADTSEAVALLELAGVEERCQVRRGDFFASVPEGGDLYILSQIIHDWDDRRASRILRNCRAAMTCESRLLLFEHVLPEHPQPGCSAVWQDLIMLVLTGGKERTQNEFATLLASCGFKLNRITPTGHPRSIIEAIPI